MKTLRTILTWINSHRFLSVVFGILIVACIWWVNNIQVRSAGILSGPLQKGTIIESVYGIGTVTASRSYQLRPGVTGTIDDIYIKEGDTVKKGTSLIKFDENIYYAPFEGTVTFLPFKIRENVYPQGPALSLVDMLDRYLVVSLEQQGALQVKASQKVKVSFDTIRDQNYDGIVDSVYSYNSNFLARISVANLPSRILPDMTGDVAIEISTHENVLLVPVAAMEQGKYVWRKRGHEIPQRVEVKTGIIDKAMAEIVSGNLQAGDRVLIRKDSSK